MDLALACFARIPRDVRVGQTMLVTMTDIRPGGGPRVMVGHSTVPGHSDVPSSQSRRSALGRRALRAALEDGTISADRLNHAAATVLAAKGIDPCSVAGRSAPDVDDTDPPNDAPVTNPTEDPR